MTASHPTDVEKLLADQLATASPNLVRSLLSTFIATLMSAEVDACAAPTTASAATSAPTAQPLSASGFRHRAGTLDVGPASPATARSRRAVCRGPQFDCQAAYLMSDGCASSLTPVAFHSRMVIERYVAAREELSSA